MAAKIFVLVFCFALTLGQEEEKEPIVLSDGNFEHLTQASTGATTGDWLILFKKNLQQCPKCNAASSVFKTLANRLHRRLNIAVVDVDENRGLLKRFNINHFPSIIFFRLGFQFTYFGELHEKRLENFALGGYRDARKEAVSKELSDFDIWMDETIKDIMISIKERKLPSSSTLAVTVGAFLFCLAFLFCCCSGSRPNDVSVHKKKQ